jgi:SpoVK/Ycf46/Vps4 family AAA+-type ATPase
MGHMILNTPKIEKDENLIEVYVNRDPKREQIINEIFSDDDHPVFKNKIFERSIDESGKADKDCVELHPDFKRKVLFGICKEVKREDVIPFAKITEQKLFYNEANEKAINDLSSLLQKDRFDEIKERLKTSGTRTGFACIFSGFPGTGKTATALQLAKQTGRDIIKVDMSGIRSKWWGEDEKNIKAIFNNYRSALQESRIEPILLLNEADAIIGKRLDVTGHNGALITAINTVQNIILEELENFEGILIATTNLTQNMDSAFERRFLYKIEFEKPNVQNRAKIWENMLQLPNDDALSLANQFDFTGAQIENIFRKKIANSILYGDNYDINQIIEMCKDEKVKKETKIGFGS